MGVLKIDTGIPPHLLRLPDIGITLISPDYRLAPQADIYSILEDANSAVEYVRTDLPRLLHIDPSKLALTGGSAGGWLGT
jgi:acetyl esterase/lipase